ncbi:MAG: hypothetical protein KGH53_02585 [Candidatus Micrarchaeota archaeon]|nr:hypothetical protein [Candidatus Micrarchaeota archaeon]
MDNKTGIGIAILAVIVAVGILAVLGSHPGAHAGQQTSQMNMVGGKTSTVVFHDAMRKLWEDHITWTRLAIVGFAGGSADFNATAARLLQNQQDIGGAIKPFYGSAAGDQLTALLRTHILDAVGVMQAAKGGNQTALAKSVNSWYANANDIADFISSANPYLSNQDMRAMMKSHLDLTLQEAADELKGNYTGSVLTYDAVHVEILGMADMLSSGIMKQFPQDFYNATLSTS